MAVVMKMATTLTVVQMKTITVTNNDHDFNVIGRMVMQQPARYLFFFGAIARLFKESA